MKGGEGGERGGPHRSAPPLFADTGLECPVCKEDYAVAEQVRQLPCNHFFHGGCIVPWLELVSASHGVPRSPPPVPPRPPAQPPLRPQHDTCPVCRKSLSGEDSSRHSHGPAPGGGSDGQSRERWTF